MRRLRDFTLLAALFVFAIVALSSPAASSQPIAEAVGAVGRAQTGAANLVAAIYLGFRAFDTLGEAVVLLTAVSGVVMLAGKRL